MLLFLISNISVIAQTEVDVSYDGITDPEEKTMDNITTRNYPTQIIDSFIVVPCRKFKSIAFETYYCNNAKYFKGMINPLLIDVDKLQNKDKEHLCQLACETREQKYFDRLVELIYTPSTGYGIDNVFTSQQGLPLGDPAVIIKTNDC